MNVMMTGRRRCALALLLAALVLSGCGKKDAPDAPEQTAQTAAYSNLSDEASKELLSELFADAGIAAERADKFFACLDQFNGSVKAEWLTDGFETAAPTETKYDPYEMQEMWMERQGDFPGYNCRITAYELMGDRITAGEDQPDTNGEDWLFMDLETLKRDPDALCGKSTADFCALFAPVEAADSTDSSVQAETLRKGWAARGVTFSDGGCSMISVVFHDRFSETENTLFIGHVGVLLPAGDDGLYFVEKVAFQEPYRLTKFESRAALKSYLMAKYDTGWGQDTTPPFLMENDVLMDGEATANARHCTSDGCGGGRFPVRAFRYARAARRILIGEKRGTGHEEKGMLAARGACAAARGLRGKDTEERGGLAGALCADAGL